MEYKHLLMLIVGIFSFFYRLHMTNESCMLEIKELQREVDSLTIAYDELKLENSNKDKKIDSLIFECDKLQLGNSSKQKGNVFKQVQAGTNTNFQGEKSDNKESVKDQAGKDGGFYFLIFLGVLACLYNGNNRRRRRR